MSKVRSPHAQALQSPIFRQQRKPGRKPEPPTLEYEPDFDGPVEIEGETSKEGRA